jgi:hypothetical protein
MRTGVAWASTSSGTGGMNPNDAAIEAIVNKFEFEFSVRSIS